MNTSQITAGDEERRDKAEIDHMEEAPVDLDDAHRAALENNPDTVETPSLSTILAVISLALGFVGPISCGFALVTGILTTIQTDLGDTHNKITWLVGGWSVASSVSFSIAGGLSDIFGRRWTILSGELICIIGSAVAATAKTVETIILASTFLGFGCGMIYVSYAGISELLPNKWRGIGLATTEFAINVPFGLLSVLLGTLLVLHTALGWRWCYYIGLIYGVISLGGTFTFYFPPTRPQYDYENTRLDQLKSLDFVGIALYVGSLTTFLVGLTWAGQPGHPWRSPSVYVPITLGLLGLIACFIYDFTIPSKPLFPLEVFKEIRKFTVLLGITFVAGMIYYSMMALLPQGSLWMYTSDQMQIAYIALPNGFVQLVFGAIGPALIGKIKHIKMQIIVMLVLQTTFTAALAAVVPHNRVAWTALQAFSVGPFVLVTIACYVTTGLHTPLRHLGLATGLIGTFRSMGGSVGNAIFNTIIHGIVNRDLGKGIAQAAIQKGFNPEDLGSLISATINAALGIPHAFASVPGITPAVETAAVKALRQVYGHAFRMVFYATIPFGIIAITLACFIEDPSMYLNNHTAVHMEKEAGFGKGHSNKKADNSFQGRKV
ncbi:putative drug facilitator PEP5 [Fusarium fujikuroi]|nr:putative drug facilitator PEP5 [Fusarium fujikuroi]